MECLDGLKVVPYSTFLLGSQRDHSAQSKTAADFIRKELGQNTPRAGPWPSTCPNTKKYDKAVKIVSNCALLK